MPKITVIVPVYNVEPYLRRCIDSILAQTFTDFELILVDDGSPDNCGAICDEYAEQDERIHVIHQSNGGLSAARNAGIDWAFACSDSEWLAFVDSDDWVHPRYLELLNKAAHECNVSLSICNFQRTTQVEEFSPLSDAVPTIYYGLDFFTSDKYVTGTVAWNKLYRKTLFDGYRYPVGKLHEDEYLTYKLLYKAGDIVYIDHVLYFYFRNDSGITGSGYSVRNLDALYGHEDQYKFFCQLDNDRYKNRWKLFLLNKYIEHIKKLGIIGEDNKAKELKKKARAFFLNECDDRVQHFDQYELGWLLFYPRRTRMRNRIRNLRNMARSKSISDILRYYLIRK